MLFYGSMMRRAPAFRKAWPTALRRICAGIKLLEFDRRSPPDKRSLEKLKRPFSRLTPAILCLLTLTLDASAATVADTVLAWGLIGPWSLDCSVAPGPGNSALTTYAIIPGDRVVYRRDFGDSADESEVIAAEVSGDGMLNLRVVFPVLKQTREFGLLMQPDGTMRAIYNRDQKRQYTIKDGKFGNGNQTPPQHKCM
jgi:hypothetical protein